MTVWTENTNMPLLPPLLDHDPACTKKKQNFMTYVFKKQIPDNKQCCHSVDDHTSGKYLILSSQKLFLLLTSPLKLTTVNLLQVIPCMLRQSTGSD